MAMFGQILTAMREQMNATLSRSDVLKPLAWLVGLLLFASVAMVFAKAETLIQYGCLGVTAFTVFLYAGAYLFCLKHDRDALRSEKYSINKMAIEHGLIGDSSAGLMQVDEMASSTKEVSEKSIQIEHSK